MNQLKNDYKSIQAKTNNIQGKDIKGLADDTLNSAVDAVDNFLATIYKLHANKNLSQVDKVAAKQKAGIAIGAQLNELHETADKFAGEAEEIRQKAAAVTSKEDPMLSFLKQKEARDKLEDNPHLLERRYLAAVESGKDELFVDAMENSPITYSFVCDETKASTKLHRLAVINPEETQRLKDITIFSHCLNMIFETATQTISMHDH